MISATPPHATGIPKGQGGSNKLPLPVASPKMRKRKRKANKAFSIDHKYEAHLLLTKPLLPPPYPPPAKKPHNKNFSNYSTKAGRRAEGAWLWGVGRICDSTRLDSTRDADKYAKRALGEHRNFRQAKGKGRG